MPYLEGSHYFSPRSSLLLPVSWCCVFPEAYLSETAQWENVTTVSVTNDLESGVTSLWTASKRVTKPRVESRVCFLSHALSNTLCLQGPPPPCSYTIFFLPHTPCLCLCAICTCTCVCVCVCMSMWASAYRGQRLMLSVFLCCCALNFWDRASHCPWISPIWQD